MLTHPTQFNCNIISSEEISSSLLHNPYRTITLAQENTEQQPWRELRASCAPVGLVRAHAARVHKYRYSRPFAQHQRIHPSPNFAFSWLEFHHVLESIAAPCSAGPTLAEQSDYTTRSVNSANLSDTVATHAVRKLVPLMHTNILATHLRRWMRSIERPFWAAAKPKRIAAEHTRSRPQNNPRL